jgi:glycosyltransferase involved in cell wall biosynthesis
MSWLENEPASRDLKNYSMQGKSAPLQARPRVLHVIDSLDLGGAQTVLLNLAKAWPRADFPLEVAAMHGEGVFAQAFRNAGIPVHSLSPHKFCPLYIWRLLRLLGKKEFTVLHCHLFGSNWIAKPLGAFCRVPLIVSHDHCNDQLRHTKKAALLIDRITNYFSDLVIGVSKSTCAFLAKYEQIGPHRLHLIHNGVDTDEFKPPTVEARAAARQRLGIRETEFLVGGVGRLVPQKNFARWLRVLDRVRKSYPQVRGLIAGTGPREMELRTLASELGLDDVVHFAGFVTDRAGLYAALDALLITSDYEGLPMNVLEAMASGIPVVGSRVDGLAEILDHEIDAFLAGVENETDFVEGLARITCDEKYREELSAAGLVKVRSSFSARTMASRILKLYSKKKT